MNASRAIRTCPVKLLAALLCAGPLSAHPISFSSKMSYSPTQPSGGAASIANWSGAAFDAANIGGSGVNADGGANNGPANDDSTYIARNRPVQGQTFTTGSNANGYDVASITVRMPGYSGNVATGGNMGGYNLNPTNGPVMLGIGKISGTSFTLVSQQNFMAGESGNPGAGATANGPGTYITFTLPYSTHLEPNTAYAFDLSLGNDSGNFFELLGTNGDPYSDGTAYTRSWGTITPLSGDRVFQVNMTASAAAPVAFAHPGALHTQADLDRMKAKVAANAQPWKASFDLLTNTPYSGTGWPAYNIDYINRGTNPNNYTRSQQDAAAIYQAALRWHITGNTAYADHAVYIANTWSDLLGVTGNTNVSLGAGICGFQFACAGELLSTYPGWAAADKQAYKDMMMRVFYPANLDFLWRQHDTFWREGGNTHYRLNWATCNMASMLAIGVLCDNRAVYEQAIDFFKYGPNNGRIERAAFYIHPDGTAQTEEVGRDQPHNLGGWDFMARMCQVAWNQGDDLYGYDNNRVLRAVEYNAKFNLWNEVPYVLHRNSLLNYSEGLSWAGRGGFKPLYEMVYNHYVNVKGLAAPYSKLVADQMRPEPGPNTGNHPSEVDWFGFGTLTYTRDPIAAGVVPGGLVANWSKNQVTLNWNGSAYATSYNIKRATTSGGPYTTVGTSNSLDLYFSDPTVANGTDYYYVVSAVTPSGETADSAELAVKQELVTSYTFEGTPNDVTGTKHGSLMGGSTGVAGYAAGFGGGQALNLDGVDDFVQLPKGIANHQDITIAAWVYWNGGANWQRIFDFGNEKEQSLYLTPSNGANMRFTITTTEGNEDSGILLGPVMPVNQWTHVAVTLNGDTGTLYVNGKPVDTETIAAVDPLFGQVFCYLGRSMYNGDATFKGRIDDFQIHNHALSGSDVYTLWGQGGANSPPVFAADPIQKPAATEDAAYAGQSLVGDASDPNGGTLSFGKVMGPAWLTVATNGTLSGTPTNSNVGVNAFQVRVTDSTGATDDATLYITVGNTNDAPVWSAGTIVKPAVTRDQPYLGVSLAGDASDVDPGASMSFSKTAGPTWLTVAANGALSGTPGAGDVGVNNFTVRVTDNATAFNEATLSITVLPFMARSHHAFEDNTADSLGNFPGTANGTPVYATGRIGRGIVLDGADDYVSLPAEVADSQDISVATWVFWKGGAANQRIFDFGNNTSQYLFLSPDSGGLRFAIKNGAAEQQIVSSTLPANQWVHVVVALGGSTATLYVNGSATGTNNAVTIHPGDFKPAFNHIGKSQWPDPLFNGTIDGFRVYNYAITPAEIAVLMDEVPAVPHGITATPKTSRIDLAWAASQGAQTYTVKRSLTNGGPYTVVANGLTAPGYADTGLTNGTPYYYVLSATNAKGESADSAQVTAVPSDLLAWLKFDETSGTTATDASGNGWHATLVNSPAWATGIFNGGVHLPATANQALTLPTGIVSGLTDFTVSGWVKVGAFGTFSRIFDFGTGTNNYMFLTPQYTTSGGNAAKFRFAIRTPSVGEQQLNSSTAVTAGTWVHYAITLSGNTGRMYLNGTQVAQNTGMTLKPSSLGSTTLNWLGDSQFGADPIFNGHLDDFRIHSRALSAAEVLAAATPQPQVPTALVAQATDAMVTLDWSAADFATTYNVKRATASGGPYTTVGSGLTTTDFTDSGMANEATYYYVVTASNAQGESAPSNIAEATPSALRVHLKFDESAGTTATDSSGRGWHGTTVNDPVWESGKSGNALKLASASSQYVTLPTGVVNGMSNATIMSRVKVSSLATWQRIFDFGTGTDNYMFLTTQYGTGGNANKLRFAIRTASVGEQVINSSVTTPANAWVHVAVVLSGSTGRLYLDGTEVGSNTGMTLNPSSLGATTKNYLGKSQWADPYLNASLDDFRIYSRALSGEEVGAIASPVEAPQGLMATASVQEVQLAWNAVANAAGYTVKLSVTAGGPYTTIASGLELPAFIHGGLTPGVTHYYVVVAESVLGESAASAEASATPESAEITAGEMSGSRLEFAGMTGSGGEMTMRIAVSVVGHRYQVQYSPDLSEGSWVDVGEEHPGTGGMLELVMPVEFEEEKGFYRIWVGR